MLLRVSTGEYTFPAYKLQPDLIASNLISALQITLVLVRNVPKLYHYNSYHLRSCQGGEGEGATRWEGGGGGATTIIRSISTGEYTFPN